MGIKDTLTKRNANLVCYTGGFIQNPSVSRGIQFYENIVYDYINTKNTDGIITYGGTISQFIDPEIVLSFCKRYAPVPVVNIATPLKGIPSVLVQNYEGMRKIIEHLIRDHNYKRIGIIKGPKNHPEANERYRAYKDVLKENGIPVNPDFISPGYFTMASGRDGVKLLIDQRKAKLDAIVAADDDTAVGAVQALQERGIRIPDDIAVVGFDNTEIAKALTPSLTTIKQPIYRQGVIAAEMIMDIISGKKVEEEIQIPTELIIRQSCGCFDEDVQESTVRITAEFIHPGITTLYAQKEEIAKNIINADKYLNVVINDEWILQLLDSLIKSLSNKSDFSFLKALNKIANHIISQKRSLSSLQNLVSLIRQLSSPYLNSTDSIRFENLLHQARIIIGKATERSELFLRLNIETNFLNDSAISRDLNTIFDIENLKSVIAEALPQLDISSCYISLYSDTNSPEKESILIFAYQNNKRIEINREGIVFDTTDILPAEFFYSDRIYSRIICPLYVGDQQIGLMIAEINENRVDAYENMGWQISSVFKRLFLLRERRERTIELENSLAALQKAQKKLVESEKMASLGNLVAGVAHEINTPLGISVTSASFLEDITNDFSELFVLGQVSKEDFKKYIDDAIQSTKGIMLNLKRAAKLIQSFKNVAVDQTSEERRRFDLKNYIDEVLLSLQNKLKKTSHKITVDCPEGLEINSYPGAYSQIIANFIMNSLIHAFKEDEEGQINISVHVKDKYLHLVYKDNGRGLTKDVKSQIYEPFFTTRRGLGGSGLGMHIVYNLVTQSLRGSIECESVPGRGVKFDIKVPMD